MIVYGEGADDSGGVGLLDMPVGLKSSNGSESPEKESVFYGSTARL